MRGKGEEGEKPAFYAIMQEFMHKRKTHPTTAGANAATGKAPTAGRTERRHRLPRQDADRQHRRYKHHRTHSHTPSRAEPPHRKTPRPNAAPTRERRQGNRGNPYTAPQEERAAAEQGQQDGQPPSQAPKTDSHRRNPDRSCCKTFGNPFPQLPTVNPGEPTGNRLHSQAGRTQARQGNKPSRAGDPLQANPRRSC